MDCVAASDGLDRRPPYCNNCRNGKPRRFHHFSVCQRCVLRMDHHCVWVVNCVGACNHKFFLLFLLYTFLETTMDTLVLSPTFVKFFDNAKNHSTSPGNLAVIFLAFGKIVCLDAVLNLAFALSLLCFIVMHASLISSNTTSIEIMIISFKAKKQDKHVFSMSIVYNLLNRIFRFMRKKERSGGSTT